MAQPSNRHEANSGLIFHLRHTIGSLNAVFGANVDTRTPVVKQPRVIPKLTPQQTVDRQEVINRILPEFLHGVTMLSLLGGRDAVSANPQLVPLDLDLENQARAMIRLGLPTEVPQQIVNATEEATAELARDALSAIVQLLGPETVANQMLSKVQPNAIIEEALNRYAISFVQSRVPKE